MLFLKDKIWAPDNKSLVKQGSCNKCWKKITAQEYARLNKAIKAAKKTQKEKSSKTH